ncbi:MAG: WbqC family protein [Nitrososphaerales archaeon]
MKVAIHQPQFFPYPGFFKKLSAADAFVIMDDVQYDKRFTNRNRILAPQGPIWLTVPIDKADKFSSNMTVEVNNAMPWRAEHWKKLTYSYKNSGFFHLYREYFEDLYRREHGLLFDLDLETTKAVLAWLDIDIPITRESELGVTGEGTERLVNVCRAMGADTYVSGVGAKNYMDEGLFREHGVSLQYQGYEPTPYRQRFASEFVPNLSILDMLFNVGPESRRLVGRTAQAELVR